MYKNTSADNTRKRVWQYIEKERKNIGPVLEVISVYFRVFSLDKRYRMGIFFGVAKFWNIFLGLLDIPVGVNSKCWVQAYVWRKKNKMRVATPTYTGVWTQLLNVILESRTEHRRWWNSVNPFKLNGISHSYQLKQSITVLRVGQIYFLLFF